MSPARFSFYLHVGALGLLGCGLAMTACIKANDASICQSAAAIDGDTIKCADGTHLRLNGIDAPELPWHKQRLPGDGIASWQALALEVDSRDLHYRPLKVDRYGRTVAEVWYTTYPNQQHDVSCAQLETGHAAYVSKWDEQATTRNTCPAAVELSTL